MAAKTQARPDVVLAKEILAGMRARDFAGALVKAEQGARQYPDFRLPTPEGQPSPTFAQLGDWVRKQMSEQDQAQPEPQPEPAPEPQPAPVKVETLTLRITHDGEHPTSIRPIVKDSPAHQAIGRNGLGWKWWRGTDVFYLARTGGFAPNWTAIREAVAAVESLEQDGVPLYRVETDVRETDADGAPLPVKMTAEQRRAWQRAYDGAMNTAQWNLRPEVAKATCAGCGVSGLTTRTGRVGKDESGMPVVKCYTCDGVAPVEETAPEQDQAAEQGQAAEQDAPMDLSGLLALPAEPQPEPESAQCPSCRQSVPVVDGRLELHTRPYTGGACRGKLGVKVEDVEPEPAQGKSAGRKATRKVAEPEPEPESQDDQDPATFVVKIAFQSGLSGQKRSETATEVRSALSRRITYGREFRGVKLEARNMKRADTPHLFITITSGGEGADLGALAGAIVAAAKGVRGVGNRIHKG